jgi:hypothetical protein
MKLRTRSDLKAAAEYFAKACNYSRIHEALGAALLTRHGDHGPQISGCIREHFPKDKKDALRHLAESVSHALESAWAARPKGVRMKTMRALGREIASEDGCGFYGPQR